MKNILLIFLAVPFFTQIISAQYSESYKTYKMESIYLKGNKYIKNDVEYPIGFLGSNLKEEMKISQFATLEWKKHVNYRNWSFVTSLTGVALTIAGFGAESENLQRGLILSGLGLSIISIPISIKSNNQIQKAIWTRNRDLLM